MNLPNWITLSRLCGLPIIVYCLYLDTELTRWLGLGIFVLAALTDWLDGYLARKLNQVTDLGKFLDPLMDKLLILIPLLVLIEKGAVPAWGVCLVLFRELAIAGWRVNQTQVTGANWWGKSKTVSQIIAVSLLIAPLTKDWFQVVQACFWISVILTLISGLIYILPKKEI